jgi:Ribosome biogenesis regulatory protein (RRS1)
MTEDHAEKFASPRRLLRSIQESSQFSTVGCIELNYLVTRMKRGDSAAGGNVAIAAPKDDRQRLPAADRRSDWVSRIFRKIQRENLSTLHHIKWTTLVMMQRTSTWWIWTDISRSLNPEKPIPLSFDLANLTAFDTNPLSQSSLLDEHSVQSIARDATQLLVNQLLSLPRTRSLEGVYIQLPAPTTPLPREKPVQPDPVLY